MAIGAVSTENATDKSAALGWILAPLTLAIKKSDPRENNAPLKGVPKRFRRVVETDFGSLFNRNSGPHHKLPVFREGAHAICYTAVLNHASNMTHSLEKQLSLTYYYR